jgi:NTE family protein
VSVCRALGAHAVIAVSLVGDSFGRGGIVIGEEGAGLAAAPSDMVPPAGPNGRGALQLIHRQLFGQKPEAAPAISSVILNSFSIVHDRIARARLMGDPPDLMISPELAGIGVFDFHRAEEMIARGEAAVRPQLAAIERYVKGGAAPPSSDAEDLA